MSVLSIGLLMITSSIAGAFATFVSSEASLLYNSGELALPWWILGGNMTPFSIATIVFIGTLWNGAVVALILSADRLAVSGFFMAILLGNIVVAAVAFGVASPDSTWWMVALNGYLAQIYTIIAASIVTLVISLLLLLMRR